MPMQALRREHAQSRNDSLTCYLNEIRAYPLLTRAEEAELAQRIRANDADALNQLVCANLRFVVSVAKKYHQPHVALADLINEGNLGLIRAAERFDDAKGVKFISYAVWWVRQAIVQSLAGQAHVIRVPLGRAGIVQRPTVSLDAPAGAEDGAGLSELLADDDSAPTDHEAAEADAESCIEAALHQLRPRDQAVLRLYFGLGPGNPMTLEEIGAIYGITRERVRQIKDHALARIRRSELSSALQSLRDR